METVGAQEPALERRRQMEAVIHEHEGGLLRYATRILNNAATAQDVVQDVFIRLFQSWEDGMRPTSNLRAWLFSATHNRAVDCIRREARLRLLHERHAQECAADPTEADPVAEQKRRVLAMVQALDERERQVLLLRLEAGLSYREISRVTGRSEGNVGNLLHHAVRKLAQRLGRVANAEALS